MRRLAWVVPLLAVGFGGCGGVSDSDRFKLRTPGTEKTVVREIDGSQKIRTGKPTKTEVQVIRGWADALRAGHVGAAAGYFALPVLVADGVSPLHSLKKRADVVDFNKTLPCGARLVDTKRGESSFVIARFKLTERPGSGQCGSRVGNNAYTAFLIERHRIVQWRSALPPGQSSGSGSSG
jgi:hypothetical protein